MPPKARQVRRGETAQQRAALRSQLGSLRDLIISTGMTVRYRNAVAYFVFVLQLLFGSIADTVEGLDGQFVFFMERCWAEGEKQPRSVEGWLAE